MMVVSDLDGTLVLTPENLETMAVLKREKIPCVIATGRTLHSAMKALAPELPLDYLVFSSGAGIYDWRARKVIRSRHLEPLQVRKVGEWLLGRGLDFMLHELIPENHRFVYFGEGKNNPDFQRRCAHYLSFSSKGDGMSEKEATQFVVIAPPSEGLTHLSSIRKEFGNLSVIRATSPLDHESFWIEIFHPQVSKGQAVNWLCEKHKISASSILALGNDYNDVDMLEMAGSSFVVGNCVEELKSRFENVAAAEANGFADAVTRWRRKSAR